MSFLADRYLLFNLEGRKTDKVCTKYWQIEEAEIFSEQCTMGQSQT